MLMRVLAMLVVVIVIIVVMVKKITLEAPADRFEEVRKAAYAKMKEIEPDAEIFFDEAEQPSGTSCPCGGHHHEDDDDDEHEDTLTTPGSFCSARSTFAAQFGQSMSSFHDCLMWHEEEYYNI